MFSLPEQECVFWQTTLLSSLVVTDTYNDSSFRILLWNAGIESNTRRVICEKIKPWTFAAEKGFPSAQDLNRSLDTFIFSLKVKRESIMGEKSFFFGGLSKKFFNCNAFFFFGSIRLNSFESKF